MSLTEPLQLSGVYFTDPIWEYNSFNKGCNGHGGHFGHSDGRDCHGRYQGNRGCFRPQRTFGKFDKSPNPKCPRVSGRPFNKNKIHCYECKEFGHIQKDCLELNKPHKEDNPDPKKFEDYTYTYSGPDIQPQMQINSVSPNMTTTYDQALGVIKDRINTANALASLDL